MPFQGTQGHLTAKSVKYKEIQMINYNIISTKHSQYNYTEGKSQIYTANPNKLVLHCCV